MYIALKMTSAEVVERLFANITPHQKLTHSRKDSIGMCLLMYSIHLQLIYTRGKLVNHSPPARDFQAFLVSCQHRKWVYCTGKPMENAVYCIYKTINLFSLYVLFSHFRPRDATRGNSFSQMSSYARANVRIINEKKKQKDNSLEGITWSEMGKQNVQTKKVYCKYQYVSVNLPPQ